VDKSVLSAADIANFRENGYIILRNAVRQELVRDALRAINHQLGKPDCWQKDPNPLNAAQLSLKLPREGVGTDIINESPVFWSVLNILLGEGNVAPWNQGQQVALRFPRPPEAGVEKPDLRTGTTYHIDGMGQNKLCPFSLLCGVALSEQMRPEMGNLHVYPGSHLHEQLHSYYRDKIDDDNQNEQDDGKPNLGKSVQVLLHPGDVVVAHQLLAHRIGLNTSEHIRYQLYYRVKRNRHEDFINQIVDNPWVEFAI
jgi:ectoine hydroxylase-related dioxygenase (phytanoyl-CoA dioxygenase family)